MKFAVSYAADGEGFRITLSVDGEALALSEVTITLDDVELASETLRPNTSQYSRELRHVGSITPGDDHQLEVVAIDARGDDHRSTTTWTD